MSKPKILPNIEAVALDIAVAMGLLNRNIDQDCLEDVIQDCVVKVMSDVSGAYSEALEAWLGTLTEEQREILADGEEEDSIALMANAPTSLSGESAEEILDDIWLMMDETLP